MEPCYCSRCTGIEWIEEEEYFCSLCEFTPGTDGDPFEFLTLNKNGFICFKCFCCYCKRQVKMDPPDYYDVQMPTEEFTKIEKNKYACKSCLEKGKLQ